MAPKTPEVRMAELTTELDRWSRQKIESRGRFSLKDAQAHLGQFAGNEKGLVNKTVVRSAMDRLGDCVSFSGPHSGFTRRACTVEQVTLARILEVAAQHINPDACLRDGVRPSRDVEMLTESQFSAAQGAARFAATVISMAGQLADVSGNVLGWDVAAGKNATGDWRLCAIVAEASDRTARKKHEATNPNTTWAPQMNAARRIKQVSSIRLLLDFAATKDLLLRGPEQAVARVATASWIPALNAWGAELGAGRSKSNAHKVRRGLMLLALYATRRGWGTPDVTDWTHLRKTILADHEQGSMNPSAMDSARFAFNLLHAAGHVPERWPLQGDSRQSLVPNAAVTAAAEGDFSGWVMPDGQFAQALTDGALGLRDWRRWATLPTSLLKGEGLPARSFMNPSDHQRLRTAKKGDRAFKQVVTTLRGRLSFFNQLAGFCASTLGIDWATQGADELCNPAHLDAFAKTRARAAGRDVDSFDSVVNAMAFNLGTLACPYLEARASQEADRWSKQGDEGQAAALRRRADELRGWSTDLKVFGIKTQATKFDKDASERRRAQATWLAWSADGVSGWHKLLTMRDLMVQNVEREFARCLKDRLPNGRWVRQTGILTVSIEDQIALIEREQKMPPAARTFYPSQAWCVLVRDAVAVTVLIRVPLRERNLVGMTSTNWKATLAGRGTAKSWEGRISFKFTAEEMKGIRPFLPQFLAADERDTPDGIASARPALLHLYLMLGGARENVLRLPATAGRFLLNGKHYGPGDAIPSPFIFPSLARKPGKTPPAKFHKNLEAGSKWEEGSFGAHWGQIVATYAPALNLDMDQVKSAFGAAGPHACRHLFGTHHCNTTDHADAIGLQNASVMLHHKDTETTLRKYVGTTEQQISVTKTATRQQQGGAEGRMAPLALATPAPTSVRSVAAERINLMMDALIERGVEGELDDAALAAALARLESFQARVEASAATARPRSGR